MKPLGQQTILITGIRAIIWQHAIFCQVLGQFSLDFKGT
jgi:hypothetical protein